MKLCFDSIAEVKEFVGSLKGTRGGKGKEEGDDASGPAPGAAHTVPAPLQPPAIAGGAFNPGPQPAAFNPGTGFPSGAGPQIDPNVAGLVNRVTARIDGAIASGQAADAVLGWFRTQCGPEASSATMDQIKQVFLPKQPLPVLENIAKLMNA